MQGAHTGSSHRELTQETHAGNSCREHSQGDFAGSSCRDLILVAHSPAQGAHTGSPYREIMQGTHAGSTDTELIQELIQEDGRIFGTLRDVNPGPLSQQYGELTRELTS